MANTEEQRVTMLERALTWTYGPREEERALSRLLDDMEAEVSRFEALGAQARLMDS